MNKVEPTENIQDIKRAMLNLLEDLAKEKELVEKKVEERTAELARAKAHADTLIESLITGLIEFDDTFTVIRINRTAERILGVQREEIVGKQILPQDLERAGWLSLVEVSYPILSKRQKKIPLSLVGITSTANEMTITYPITLDIQVITTPVTLENGQTSGFIKVIRDISREKLIARSKSEFISIAAHQLRTDRKSVV
jgi:signal transduction histidine kinase